MPRSLQEVLVSLGLAIALALIIRTCIVSIYKIPTSSMQPNLLAGDFVISYKLPYGFYLPWLSENKIAAWAKPQRGEIFVFRLPSNPKVNYVKRIVAIGGDELEIKNNILYINGEAAKYEDTENSEPIKHVIERWESLGQMKHKVWFAAKEETDSFAKITVPENSVFVLGDNRDSSDDSRYWGAVSLNDIESKVFGIWFSVNVKSRDQNILKKIQWERIFKGL